MHTEWQQLLTTFDAAGSRQVAQTTSAAGRSPRRQRCTFNFCTRTGKMATCKSRYKKSWVQSQPLWMSMLSSIARHGRVIPGSRCGSPAPGSTGRSRCLRLCCRQTATGGARLHCCSGWQPCAHWEAPCCIIHTHTSFMLGPIICHQLYMEAPAPAVFS